MNEVINETNDQKEFYSTFSISSLILTLTKCFIIIINIFLDIGISSKYPILSAALVLAILGRKKYHDKLSLIMIIVDIILIILLVIVYIITFILLADLFFKIIKG